MTEPAPARLRQQVRRLSRRLRLRRALESGSRGLFFGLIAAVLLAAASGSVTLPRPILLAAGVAAVGAAVGATAGFVRRVDRRGLLVRTDIILGSRELIETGHELAVSGSGGTFTGPVIEDAADLLARTPPARALGRRRLPLAPFLPALGALVVAAFLFPVNIPALFARRASAPSELASIGEDLQGLGERLEEASRAQDLGRRLALSQELAQLGSELADRTITSDEALGRISDLEGRVAREYQLQMESALASALAPHPRSGGSTPGSSGTGSPAGDAPPDAAGSDSASGDSQDLANALDRLRDARKTLESGDQANRGSTPGGDSSGNKGRTQGGGSSQPGALPGQAGSTTGNEEGDGTGGEGSDTGAGQGNPDAAAGSAPGTAPAPDIHGPPTPIQRGGTAPPEQARGNVGEGDTTSFLVRALPEWTGSKLPEDATRREYAQAAETALQRDEVPPKLKAAVRDYFTDIGMTAGGQPAAGNPPGTSSTNPPGTSEGGQ